MSKEGLEFYRCMTCGHVVSFWDIKQGGCKNCGGTRVKPSYLSWWEKVVQVAKHPKVWAWPSDGDL